MAIVERRISKEGLIKATRDAGIAVAALLGVISLVASADEGIKFANDQTIYNQTESQMITNLTETTRLTIERVSLYESVLVLEDDMIREAKSSDVPGLKKNILVTDLQIVGDKLQKDTDDNATIKSLDKKYKKLDNTAKFVLNDQVRRLQLSGVFLAASLIPFGAAWELFNARAPKKAPQTQNQPDLTI